MATISGNVIFDRDRSATISSGDSGLANIPVVLQNISTTARLTVLTDAAGNYAFINVPDGNYRIVESYGAPDGVPTPADFSTAVAGSVPQGVNPPITAATNPPPGSTNLDSVTPDTLLVSVSGNNLTNQNFLNGPVIYTPIQDILDPCAIISGDNLINVADDGTFGTFPQGTPANTGAPTEPYPGVTPDFTYVLPNPDIFAPLGGEYTVQNIMNNSMSEVIGAWWRIADHTEGNETGRMMVINGFNPGAVFFRDVVAVQPNTNYLFTSWILNLFKVNGYPNPELGVRVLDQNGGVLYSETLGILIPVNVNAPEWKQIGSVINSQNNTSLTIEFLSEGPEVVGNDYAIDDISFNEIQVPQFIPVKTVDRQTANVGETVQFTVTLTNTCSSPLFNLFFFDILPNGLSFVDGSVIINGTTRPIADPNGGFVLPDLAGGETVTVTFTALVDSIPSPNPALNTATIDYAYTPVEGGIPGNFRVTTNEVPVEVGTLADISVVKTASPSPALPGELLTYTIQVANAGPSAADNVMLMDDIPASLANVEFSVDGGITFIPWSSPYALGILAVGASRTILIRGVLSSSAIDVISNTATVSSTTPDPNPDNNTFTVDTLTQPSADLSIIKTASPSPVLAGDVLTYTLLISNAGPSIAVNTNLNDIFPSELDYAEISTDGGSTWAPFGGSFFLGNLEPNTSQLILIRATVSFRAGESLTNTATVTSGTPDPDPDNNSSTVVTPVIPMLPLADLSIVKTASPSPVQPGAILNYTMTISNAGPSDAQNVILQDAVSSELTNVEFSLDGGITWQPWSGTHQFGTLAAGNRIVVLLRGTVSDTATGNIPNTATISSSTPDPDPDNNTSTVVTPVVPVTPSADLSIQKTACPDPVRRNQCLTYTITVRNAGPDTAHQVTISDVLPPDLCKPVFSLDNGRTWQPWTGSHTVGSIPARSSISIQISAIFNSCATCNICNTAKVFSITPDPDPSNNCASTTVCICK